MPSMIDGMEPLPTKTHAVHAIRNSLCLVIHLPAAVMIAIFTLLFYCACTPFCTRYLYHKGPQRSKTSFVVRQRTTQKEKERREKETPITQLRTVRPYIIAKH